MLSEANNSNPATVHDDSLLIEGWKVVFNIVLRNGLNKRRRKPQMEKRLSSLNTLNPLNDASKTLDLTPPSETDQSEEVDEVQIMVDNVKNQRGEVSYYRTVFVTQQNTGETSTILCQESTGIT
jgi:hypothetical protein